MVWPQQATPAGLRWGHGRLAAGGESSVDWVMPRQDAWSTRQLLASYAVLCALALWAASLAWTAGPMAVMPLAWVGSMLAACALWAAARHVTDRECIALRDGRLTVEHLRGRRVERAEFQSAWVRIEPEHGEQSLIELSGQGRRIAVGRYVRPEQRRQLADELRRALRWRRGGAGSGRHQGDYEN
jgi:uncharacterized membrane protein